MTPETVMDLAHQGMIMSLILAGPPLAVALFFGLFVSLFQAATQINEMTLSFIPKILAVLAILSLTGPYMLQELTDYTQNIFLAIPTMANQ